jgi:hypothetical protein
MIDKSLLTEPLPEPGVGDGCHEYCEVDVHVSVPDESPVPSKVVWYHEPPTSSSRASRCSS